MQVCLTVLTAKYNAVLQFLELVHAFERAVFNDRDSVVAQVTTFITYTRIS